MFKPPCPHHQELGGDHQAGLLLDALAALQWTYCHMAEFVEEGGGRLT